MTVLLPLLVVLLTTYACGALARRFGQARVIGEMLGGILLGPTLFGRMAPSAWHALFTADTLKSFDTLSTLGLVLFLFLVGMDLDVSHLRRQMRTTIAATVASLVLPFSLAVAIAKPAAHAFGIATTGTAFVLFFGISLSITAFPVLARILQDRNLAATPLGVTALLCAAADDVCAWLLLAVAMSFLPHTSAAITLSQRLALLVLYLLVMASIAAAARRWSALHGTQQLSLTTMAGALLAILASAAATDALGLHPLFGAFVAGLCFPRVPHWREALKNRLELPVTSLLIPIFFATTGLRLRLDMLRGRTTLQWLAIIVLLAIAGKVGGGALAGRLAGESWRNAFALGALLNTRGLVELIVLNIALTQGVFSPSLYTVLVVMALVTTLMTTPLLHLLRVGRG